LWQSSAEVWADGIVGTKARRVEIVVAHACGEAVVAKAATRAVNYLIFVLEAGYRVW
jgi:hypothetical protein